MGKTGNAFGVSELCRRVYRGVDRVEKKHRVAVLRAIKVRSDLVYLRSSLSGGELIFFTSGSVMAYAPARLKATNYVGRPETELRARLRRGGLCRELVVPGGDWYRQVEQFKAGV